jgi:hypothetical protein
MTRSERVDAIAEGLQQCVDRLPSALANIKSYWAEREQFAPGSHIASDYGLV